MNFNHGESISSNGKAFTGVLLGTYKFQCHRFILLLNFYLHVTGSFSSHIKVNNPDQKHMHHPEVNKSCSCAIFFSTKKKSFWSWKYIKLTNWGNNVHETKRNTRLISMYKAIAFIMVWTDIKKVIKYPSAFTCMDIFFPQFM